MNLGDLQLEVLNHGFDPAQYGTRINTYLNDAQNLIARRVDYYGSEATQSIVTATGTAIYSWPANLARVRSLFDSVNNIEMQYCSVRDIDRSSQVTGQPMFYALNGPDVELYPTPDGVYDLTLRYWQMPAPLVNPSDTPSLPADWHHLLWVYSTWLCYEADDDPQMGQYWQQRFNTELSQLAADVKFPDTDGPSQADSMWDSDKSLGGSNSWTLYGTGW